MNLLLWVYMLLESYAAVIHVRTAFVRKVINAKTPANARTFDR